MECRRASLIVAAPHEERQSSRSDDRPCDRFRRLRGRNSEALVCARHAFTDSSDARRIDEMRPERNRTWSASGWPGDHTIFISPAHEERGQSRRLLPLCRPSECRPADDGRRFEVLDPRPSPGGTRRQDRCDGVTSWTPRLPSNVPCPWAYVLHVFHLNPPQLGCW